MSATPDQNRERISALERRLEGVLLRDRSRLSRSLTRRDLSADALDRIESEVERSEGLRSARQVDADRIEYPVGLPVSGARDRLLETIGGHPVVIVAGDTGSGKTTQLPKICLELGRGSAGRIAHTQPRRIAARSVSLRIAEELGVEAGSTVGWKVRFEDRTSDATAVKLLTDGMLLQELQADPELLEYDTVIVDEAHERSLNIDFLLGHLKRLLARRSDLKLVITSATIETDRLSAFFDDAPVVEVEGRTFPVEYRYRPAEDPGDDLASNVSSALDELWSEGSGDVLVFLPGERQIHDLYRSLKRGLGEGVAVLPLFGRLPTRQQQAIFHPGDRPRVVLATNIAETSLTVPGIRYVIDAGTARISRYSPRTKVQRLPVEPVSQASAAQRAGRCGRVEDGICIRLYAQEDLEARPRYTDPEILRTNLASVILRLKALGIGEVEDFPFLDPPNRRQVTDAYRLLDQLQALDASGHLTEIGRRIARMPVDPRHGRVLVEAERLGVVPDVLTVVAGLSVQDPRIRPEGSRDAADEAHARFRDERSDFVSALNLFGEWRQVWETERERGRRRWCERNHLSYQRLREWQDVRRQLASEIGLRPGAEGGSDYEPLHRALLSGLLDHIGLKEQEGRGYLGPRGLRFHVFPGSVLARKGPRWLMAAELVETSRLFARTAAMVQPGWIEAAAEHLVNVEYGDPYWDERQGRSMVRGRVSLYGLQLTAGRRTPAAGVDPDGARRCFLAEGVVGGGLGVDSAALADNSALLAELEALADRRRDPSVVPSEEDLIEHYHGRIPERIRDRRAFQRWLKRDGERAEDALRMDRRRWLTAAASEGLDERFPERIEIAGGELPVSYRFAPGDPRDGVTLEVPADLLPRLSEQALAVAIPGLVEERIVAMIRALPKRYRRRLVPVPDFARACRQAMRGDERALIPFLSAHILRMTGMEVPLDAWDLSAVPDHLSPTLRVIDADGETVAEGRELEALCSVAPAVPERTDEVVSELPEEPLLEPRRERVGGAVLERFETLELIEGRLVRRWVADRGEAEERLVRTLLGLARKRFREQLKLVQRTLRGDRALVLAASRLGAVGERSRLERSVEERTLRLCLSLADGPPTNRDEWEARLSGARSEIVATGERVAGRFGSLAEVHHALAVALAEVGEGPLSSVAARLAERLEGLVSPRSVDDPDLDLDRLPVYVQALGRRLEQARGALKQDAERDAPLLELEARLAALEERAGPRWAWPEALVGLRWTLEELHVSVFAQNLGAAERVSVKRLNARLDEAAEGLIRRG